MISLTNHDFQWGRSEVVIIYPEQCLNSQALNGNNLIPCSSFLPPLFCPKEVDMSYIHHGDSGGCFQTKQGRDNYTNYYIISLISNN